MAMKSTFFNQSLHCNLPVICCSHFGYWLCMASKYTIFGVKHVYCWWKKVITGLMQLLARCYGNKMVKSPGWPSMGPSKCGKKKKKKKSTMFWKRDRTNKSKAHSSHFSPLHSPPPHAIKCSSLFSLSVHLEWKEELVTFF